MLCGPEARWGAGPGGPCRGPTEEFATCLPDSPELQAGGSCRDTLGDLQAIQKGTCSHETWRQERLRAGSQKASVCLLARQGPNRRLQAWFQKSAVFGLGSSRTGFWVALGKWQSSHIHPVPPQPPEVWAECSSRLARLRLGTLLPPPSHLCPPRGARL